MNVVTAIGSGLPSLQAQRSGFEAHGIVDADLDGDVDLDDYNLLNGDILTEYGATPRDAVFDGRNDLNGDNVIDDDDREFFTVLAPGIGPEDAAADSIDPAFAAMLDSLSDAIVEGEEAGILADIILGSGGGKPASGDVDGNGVVDQYDVLVARAMSKLNESDAAAAGALYHAALDIDRDGDVDISDVAALAGMSASASTGGVGASQPWSPDRAARGLQATA